MTVRNIEYVKREVSDHYSIGQYIEYQKDVAEIEKAKRFFTSFAKEIDGGIIKTWLSRNVARTKGISKNLKVLIDLIGMENVEKIVATNVLRLTIPRQSVELTKYKNNLLEKYDIKDQEDLDLRYIIDNRDYFIFWDSILCIIDHIKVN